MMINFRAFDSLAELAAYGYDNRELWRKYGDDAWAGASFEQARDMATTGDLSRVAASDALLDKFESLVQETYRRAWRDDVVGAIPNVPAFIAGHPTNMRRRTRVANEYAPIAIYVNIGVSVSFKHDAIAKRGAAVLALARILSTRRPVELHVGAASYTEDNDPCAVSARIDTAPLDLARAAYAMTAPAFMRRVAFPAVKGVGGRGALPIFQGDHAPIGARLFPHCKRMVFIPALVSDKDETVRDPQAWIIAQIRAAAPEMLPEVE